MPVNFSLTYACEGLNNVVASTYPKPDEAVPHVAISLAHGDKLIVARLSPGDARSLGQALANSADGVQPRWDEYEAGEQAGDDTADVEDFIAGLTGGGASFEDYES